MLPIFPGIARLDRVGIAQHGRDRRMHLAARHRLGEGAERRGRAAGQIGVQIGLEILDQDQKTAGPVAEQLVQAGDRNLGNVGAETAHLFGGAADDRRDFGVFRRGLHDVGEDADARAAQPVGLEKRSIGGRDVADAERGLRIVGVVAHGRVEHEREIGDAARHRAADVLGARQRHDAGAAGEPLRAADAGETVMRRRDADRAAGVAAHPDRGEIGGDGGAGAAARPARIAVERIGIAGLAEQRPHRGHAIGELVHVRLGDDRAGRPQPPDQGGVDGGTQPLSRTEPAAVCKPAVS